MMSFLTSNKNAGGSKFGNPCPKLTALCCCANGVKIAQMFPSYPLILWAVQFVVVFVVVDVENDFNCWFLFTIELYFNDFEIDNELFEKIENIWFYCQFKKVTFWKSEIWNKRKLLESFEVEIVSSRIEMLFEIV